MRHDLQGYTGFDISSIVGKFHDKFLESLLQVSTYDLTNADFVLSPIFQYMLLKKNGSTDEMTEESYIQHVVACRKVGY